jgi:hypothetical protein
MMYIPDFQGSFVHDTTIVRERVYVAYWTAGVMILARRLEAGAAPETFVLNGPESIAPVDFDAHHSYPTPNGDFCSSKRKTGPWVGYSFSTSAISLGRAKRWRSSSPARWQRRTICWSQATAFRRLVP